MEITYRIPQTERDFHNKRAEHIVPLRFPQHYFTVILMPFLKPLCEYAYIIHVPLALAFVHFSASFCQKNRVLHRNIDLPHASFSRSSDHAALAGLVDGIFCAGIPVRGSWYWS